MNERAVLYLARRSVLLLFHDFRIYCDEVHRCVLQATPETEIEASRDECRPPSEVVARASEGGAAAGLVERRSREGKSDTVHESCSRAQCVR